MHLTHKQINNKIKKLLKAPNVKVILTARQAIALRTLVGIETEDDEIKNHDYAYYKSLITAIERIDNARLKAEAKQDKEKLELLNKLKNYEK